VLLADHADGARCPRRGGVSTCELMSSGEKPRNADHRGEVASRQASPRRSMSTNTLRMVKRW